MINYHPHRKGKVNKNKHANFIGVTFDEFGVRLEKLCTGRSLDTETIAAVTSFYLRDDISSLRPGKKDYLSVTDPETSQREHVQKRLLLCNVGEAYQLFKTENPGMKIGVTTFSQLRPPQCVLAGSGGTHSVCVCPFHENIRLAISGIPLIHVVQLDNQDYN